MVEIKLIGEPVDNTPLSPEILETLAVATIGKSLDEDLILINKTAKLFGIELSKLTITDRVYDIRPQNIVVTIITIKVNAV